MVLRRRLGELIVPAIVLIGCFLYWWHVQDARAVARRVPDAVILFTIAMTAVALLREILFPPRAGEDGAVAPSVPRDVFMKRVAFILLCLGYFLSFQWIGFNLTNFVFLVLACRLAGLHFVAAVPTAAISAVVFHLLARLMDFRVPTGPFGI